MGGQFIDLQGHSLTVEGNLIHSGGSLKLSGGDLRIAGDYRVQKPVYDEATGELTDYAYSTGYLYMQNAADYLLVEGDFVLDSSADQYGRLNDGILEIKGNFTQKSTYPTTHLGDENFDTSENHKTILSGSGTQSVSFEDPSSGAGHFNILEIKNNSGQTVLFPDTLNVTDFITLGGTFLGDLHVASMAWNLTRDQVIAGDLYLDGQSIDLQGHSLTVEGNLIHSGGSLKLSGGDLRIAGDYRVQKPVYDEATGELTDYAYSTGYLYMQNAADYLLVEGDFVLDSSADQYGRLNDGVLEIKGNFTQKSTYPTTHLGDENFDTSENHKTILSGSGTQSVSFEDPSSGAGHFN
ncbi:hypothetical protein, partial [Candidatus Venteria ishoeyi]|uniref:hypothetical protein n=1 Tax=Candidatus Venteria ishoeyi TaxID=1899563 RepID=UPI00255C8F23